MSGFSGVVLFFETEDGDLHLVPYKSIFPTVEAHIKAFTNDKRGAWRYLGQKHIEVTYENAPASEIERIDQQISAIEARNAIQINRLKRQRRQIAGL